MCVCVCVVNSAVHMFAGPGNGVNDEDELVGLCAGEFSELAGAVRLGSGASMRVKHLRSYTEGMVKDYVMKHGGPDGLVPSWLNANSLRVLLRDYQSPTTVKKLKGAKAIPPLVFGEGQGLVSLLFAIRTHIFMRSSGVCAGNYKVSASRNSVEQGRG